MQMPAKPPTENSFLPLSSFSKLSLKNVGKSCVEGEQAHNFSLFKTGRK